MAGAGGGVALLYKLRQLRGKSKWMGYSFMNISLRKTIAQIERCLPNEGGANADQLRKMYDLTLRLQSQLLSIIYDTETFGGATERIANAHSGGENKNGNK